MTAVLVVGQAPSRAMKPGDPPLWGTKCLTLLAKYCGVHPRERLYDIFDFDNVVDYYPGPSASNPKYDAFPMDAAIEGAARVSLRVRTHRYDHVVLLGRSAARVLSLKDYEFFEPMPRTVGTHPFTLYVSPHPGGTNMWWNDLRNRQQGQEFWASLAAFAQEGSEPQERLVGGIVRPMFPRLVWDRSGS